MTQPITNSYQCTRPECQRTRTFKGHPATRGSTRILCRKP